MLKKIFLIGLVLSLPGCYSTDYISFDSMNYPPTKNCQVIEDLNNCEYEYFIFAMLQKKARTTITTPAGAVESIIEDAKDYGADAITQISLSTNRIENPSLIAQNIDVVSAKLVRFKRDSNGNFIKRNK